MNRNTFGLLVLSFVLLPLLTAQAQTSSGRIAVSGKAPDLSGPQDLTFILYDAEVGGNAFYVDSQTVDVNTQPFTAVLDAGTGGDVPADIFAALPSVFIAIEETLNPGFEIAPRVPIHSSGYARNAATLGNSVFTDASGNVGIGTTTPQNTRLNVVAGPGAANIDGVHSSTSSVGGTGVVGSSSATIGTFTTGVRGETSSPTGAGVEALSAAGLAGNLGLRVTGRGLFTGIVSKPAGSFKIDHPLEPANKYLYHSFVESPDMMNIYNGNVILDANGEAWVELPKYFEGLNRDFRYSLTAIGAPRPNLYIAEEVSGNHFKIAGGKSGSKVSWQVTGVRKDPFAEKYRITVEQEKPAGEKGYYLYPDLYGQPKTKGVAWARDPDMMKGMEERESGLAREQDEDPAQSSGGEKVEHARVSH